MNSELSNIHTLIMCLNEDIKKYGFAKILFPFLCDLEKLESDEGVKIRLNNQNFILRASIFEFSGDGLATHEVYNLLGPSANRFCRMCMYSRDDLHSVSFTRTQERTREFFAQRVEDLIRTNFSDVTKTSIGV